MRLFQINEVDLAELERTIPEIVGTVEEHLDNRSRTMARRIREILVNVRWSYGPATEVEVIRAE